ncbi:hypothetical protein N9917_01025 [Deltaproteobacteria bacterium]|nr:hypothetical protein [Deltaproteobacteria bacterium]
MAKKQESLEVAKIRPRDKIRTGKPRKLKIASSMRSRFASGGGMGGGGSVEGAGGNFYSPELSTDFLELPQSLHEQWAYYRFFAENEPFVGQALDLHTELPLSKVRISIPKAKSRDLALAATRYCEKWGRRVGLLHRLIEFVYDYNLIGEVNIFAEDANPEEPQEVRYTKDRVLYDDGTIGEEEVLREDADERAAKWNKENYKGWTALRVIPPEQVHIESFPFTDEKLIEMIPDSKTKDVISKADSGDQHAKRISDSMPQGIVAAVREGKNIPLNTDPDAGSFIYHMARKKSQYKGRGTSILQRCIRVLVFRDKLRQANTSIASRHMTPIRIVWGEDMSEANVDEVREQVDMALMDPDYSIITNFQLNWEEPKGERLLELSGEYDLTDRQLYAGLGVTESLLSGESSYSGDRINLEVINTRYMLLREVIQDFVEEFLFKPMCARMGFIEVDEDGEEVVVYPKLSFTRLALRDNADTFDALFNLYNKGSLDVDVILELLNIDPVATLEKLNRDKFTLNDPTFNEVMRGIYGEVGRALAENSDVTKIIADNLGLDYNEPEEEGGGRY